MLLAHFALAALLAAAPPRPFTAEDLNAMDRITNPQVSPDGKSVVFEVRVTDLAADKGRFDLWLASVEGKQVRQLTAHEANDTGPQWNPDGSTVLFLSTRSGSSQVWELPLSGGESRQLTSLPVGVAAFQVFPDGQRLLLSLDVDPMAPAKNQLAQSARIADAKPTVRAYDSLMYRHWDTWEDGLRQQLFVWKRGDAAPTPRMAGFDGDVPTKPFGGTEDFALSPDGKEIAFAAKRVSRDNAWTTDVNVWTVAVTGNAPPRVITGENAAWDGSPSYSPDGRYLAYLTMRRPGYEADLKRLVLIDRATQKRRVVAEGWDRSISEYRFSADGKTVWVTADHLGQHALFAIDLERPEPKLLVEQGYTFGVQESGDRLVFAHDTLTRPAELFSVAKQGGTPLQLTHLNGERLRGLQLGEPEQFQFTGAKGETVYGYLVKPAGMKAGGKKYPVSLIIHGGPQGSMGNHWHYRWNPQVYAGAGQAVLFIDFHGSTGYGQAFTDAIRNDWGGAPFEDLMKGLDHAYAQYRFLDAGRACALGASYGGYMVNWLAGNTDRFKCLVNHDGLFDLESMFYQTEELWFPEWELGGTPYEKPEGYARWTPKAHVSKWKTPMLVIHGGKDYRVTDAQGMATFTALQRRGVPSRLLHFEQENHWVLKPQNSLRWHQEVLAWIARWTK